MNYFLHICIIAALWYSTTLGYSFLFGKGKIMHFGPAGVSLAASYAFALTVLATGSYVAGIIVALILATFLSFLISWISLRLEPDGFGVMSIALHLALIAIVLNWPSLTRGALGLQRFPRIPALESLPMFALASGSVAVLWILFYAWLNTTKFARQLQALGEHESHAKALGINRPFVHTVIFLIMSFAAVSNNFFYTQFLRLVHPNDFLFGTFLFLMMAMVAGKPGSVWGVVLSTTLLVFLREGMRFLQIAPTILGPVQLILFGLIIFVSVFLQRNTLFPRQRTL